MVDPTVGTSTEVFVREATNAAVALIMAVAAFKASAGSNVGGAADSAGSGFSIQL